jgi:hypothetical protein
VHRPALARRLAQEQWPALQSGSMIDTVEPYNR